MSGTISILKLLTGVALAGFVVSGAAQAQSSGTSSPPPATQASRVPLPSSGPSANPAQPNCYPDINHCASYPTGDSVKDNSYQSISPEKPAQQPGPQQGK